MLLTCKNLKCQYGEKILINDITFNIRKNDKIGLIGVNTCWGEGT